MIEGYFVRTIEEVIGANPTLKKTKIQQEPAKAEKEVGCCSRKNGHILPTGQWYAPSAVINDALILQ